MSDKFEGCQLEVDGARGVLYVHSSEGVTLVRVSRIPPRVIGELIHQWRHYQDHRGQGMIDVVFDRELAKGIR